jgi:predicted nucleotidyltransferase
VKCTLIERSSLAAKLPSIYTLTMRMLLENLPLSLQGRREILARCLEAMDRTVPLRRVILFGSHARGEARPDSDVDLCLVSDGAELQIDTAAKWRRAMRPIENRPSFTLLPITPRRLAEKQAVDDHFFHTVLNEGVLLATED